MTEISEQAASGEVDRQAYEFAEGLVLQAGGLIRDSLAAGNYTSAWKEDNTPVTSIDIAVNKLVIEELHRQYPGDRVYGEEESSDAEGEQSGNTWVLDPIDGTQVHGEGLVTNGKIYDSIEGAGGKIENRRALAYGCMQVARGLAAGAYIGVKTPFEAASVKLIVEGAGGTVTDLYGGDAGRLDGEIRGLVVSNGLVHQELLAALQPAETNN
jgi:fructose-1,6-bisphosphatase/inositol monophosphatase family enzyme